MRTQQRDAGMGLAELIVAMGLLVVITTLVGTVAVLTIRTTDGTQARLDNTSQGELAIAAAGKVLRTAVLPDQLDETACPACADRAVLQATPTKVEFYANVGQSTLGPSLVLLQVVEDVNRRGTAVLQQVSQLPLAGPDDSYYYCDRAQTSCVKNTHVLARGLVWPSSGVFGYYDYQGQRMAGGVLSGALLPSISSIDLVVKVNMRPGNTDRYPARTTVTRVRLPNVDIDTPGEDT